MPCPRCKTLDPIVPHRGRDDAFEPAWFYSCPTPRCRETFPELIEIAPDDAIAIGFRVEGYGDDGDDA